MLKLHFISKIVLLVSWLAVIQGTMAESEKRAQQYLAGPFIGLGVSYERSNVGWDGAHTIFQPLFNLLGSNSPKLCFVIPFSYGRKPLYT